jgi:PIN domain nuclease of toxin-antitoxin system
VTTLLLDSHVLHWWSFESPILSQPAIEAIAVADELAVASVSWYELAWLAQHERIDISLPLLPWLEGLSREVRTMPTTPAIAATAVGLPASFPGDPADRVIYATAIEHGWQLVTRDLKLRRHRHPRQITVW